MGNRDKAPANIPMGHPDPQCNTGYAEPKPEDRAQAQIPGARPDPDPEEGGLEHAPDQAP